jgi:hypothetical protein
VLARTTVLLLSLAATVFSGCGRAPDDQAVGTVTQRFLAAVEDHQGARACAQLSAQAAQALEHDESKRCAEAVIDLDLAPSPVRRTQVFGIAAKVDLANGHSVFFEMTKAGWRVAAAGCVPQPDDEPYRCEVEA